MVTSYPEGLSISKKQLVSEAKWYNTLMDWIGIVDPTGTVDLINAFSYYKQGDHFYAFLSFLSAVPFADVVTKPVMVAAKASKGSTRTFRTAVGLMKTNPKKASNIIQSLKTQKGPVGKFLTTAPGWAPKVINTLKSSPVKGGLVATIIGILTFILKNPRVTKSASKTADMFTSPTANQIDDSSYVETSVEEDPLMKMFNSLFSDNTKL